MGATWTFSHEYLAGATLLAGQLNTTQSEVLSNFTPTGMDDYSSNAAEMQTTTDPYPSQAESLATSGAGELARIRYLIKQITNQSQWYIDPKISLGNFVGVATGGTGAAYTATLSPAPDPVGNTYVSGLHYFILFSNTNSSTAPTIALNGQTAQIIKKIGASGSMALEIGDIAGGHSGILKYDGTDMILLNPMTAIPRAASTTISMLSTTAYTGTVTDLGANSSTNINLLATAQTHAYYLLSAYATSATTPVIYGSDVGVGETVIPSVHCYIVRDNSQANDYLRIVNGTAGTVTVVYSVLRIAA